MSVCLGIAAATIITTVLHRFNRNRLDFEAFEERTQMLIERAESLAERSATFDQAEALDSLGVNPINGPVYRFDDRWREASLQIADTGTSVTLSPESKGVHFDFEGRDTHRFDPEFSNFEIEQGILKTRYSEGMTLKSVEPFSIPWDDAASVRFRMKLDRGEHVEFAFARGLIPIRTRVWDAQMGLVTADVIPDGEFHTYEVNIRDAFQYDYGSIGKIQRLFFRPSSVEGDEVEIDYIHIVRRKARYLENPVGTTYETLNLDARPVLYMVSPLGLRYEVQVPEKAPHLRFGLGTLDQDDPVTFTVTLSESDASTVVFKETLAWQDVWEDFEVDLEAWAGKDVALQLNVSSAEGNIAFWSNPTLQGAAEKRLNVVLLLEDTLRADHLSLYGHERRTSPFKDKLAAESVVFETAFAQATETRPSCPTLMTSLYPTSTGVYYFTNQLSDRYLTLAEILRSQGFRTAAFIQNNQAGRIAGLHQGYSHFFERYDLTEGPQVVYSDRLDSWLDQHADENFFLYLHILDPHDPYEPKPPFDSWAKEPSKENPGQPQEGFELDRSHYDGEILGNDTAFAGFVENLKGRGVWEDTLFVFVSDHGEFFGEHGGLQFHIPPAYSQVIHVPLMMRYPAGLPGGKRVRTPVGLIDVMPTVLELTQVNPVPLLMAGDSLVPIIASDEDDMDAQRLIVTDDVRDMELGEPVGWGAMLFGGWHVINSRRFVDEEGEVAEPRVIPQSWLMRFFNYAKSPDERNQDMGFAIDLLLKRAAQDRLHQLQTVNTRIREGVTRGEEAESSYDPETLKRLRDLGYIK